MKGAVEEQRRLEKEVCTGRRKRKAFDSIKP
jgi:hypothetical protein